jgi:23S rRNA (uracil1939-C5)-methyltransferase
LARIPEGVGGVSRPAEMTQSKAAGKPELPTFDVDIESFDHEGRGVAHHEGKVIFVEGALPGERVSCRVLRGKKNYALAEAIEILRPSSARETPRCRHFGICGGCSSQHMDLRSQIAAKQRVLEDNLWHIGRVKPETMLPAIHGPAWEYRYKARLSARLVVKKGGMLVGFHERKSSFVADMDSCEILPQRISRLLLPLRELIGSLSIRDQLPQIELAVGERTGEKAGEYVDVLVLRVLQQPNATDGEALAAFAEKWGIQFWLQPKGPETAHLVYPAIAPALSYSLPEFELDMPFSPTDFTQVNHQINRLLVRRAMQLLQPLPGDRVADFFCGLGNFTLPIARLGASAFGVEGNQRLVERARANAEHNGLAERCEFVFGNLFETGVPALAGYGKLDKALIDPPREGALELVKTLLVKPPQRIVYVSCNPATLARDAGVLCHADEATRYRLTAAGVVNMFPHTSHVESVALFELPPQ